MTYRVTGRPVCDEDCCVSGRDPEIRRPAGTGGGLAPMFSIMEDLPSSGSEMEFLVNDPLMPDNYVELVEQHFFSKLRRAIGES